MTGAVSLLGETGTVADAANASYFDCPDGTAIGAFGRGDRVLITGRDDSGDWAEVRSPEAANARVWMRSRQVLADRDTTGLPVVGCNVPVVAIFGDIPDDNNDDRSGRYNHFDNDDNPGRYHDHEFDDDHHHGRDHDDHGGPANRRDRDQHQESHLGGAAPRHPGVVMINPPSRLRV